MYKWWTGRQYRHGEYAEDILLLEVGRHFRVEKDMGESMNIVDNVNIVENMNMVEI